MRGPIAIVVLLASSLFGQPAEFVRMISPFPVSGPTGLYEMPFLGGFNAPRPQFADIDADGDFDLFVQEKNRSIDGSQPGQLIFFENVGTPETWQFEWRSDFFEQLDIGTWYRLLDADGDSDLDLFTEGARFQIRYWRNVGDPRIPVFSLAIDSLKDVLGNTIVIELGSFPEWADIDCDGDFDLFYGNSADGTVTFFENIGSTSDFTPQYRFITGNYQNIMIIGETNQAYGKTNSVNLHGSNSFTFSDLDGDNVLDLFWGDQFEPSIVYFHNSGSCEAAIFTMIARHFPTSEPLMTSGFNIPRFADIDADGDADMFVGILGGFAKAENFFVENFLFYQNDGGTVEEPQLRKVSSQFIATCDIGDHSIPALIDIDADGDLDLFLANGEDPSEPLQSHIHLFENSGSAAAPSFVLTDNDYLQFDAGRNLAPAFVDIDADQDSDLFIGEWGGKLLFQENMGSPDSAAFSMPPGNWDNIDVGNFCTPAFADIDADGDFDMFLGEFFPGTINYYNNVGSSTTPDFVLMDAAYFGIDVGGHSYPAFADIDGDDDLDLFVGSGNDRLVFYRNTGNAWVANFEADSAFGFKQRPRLTPVFKDIDADGDLDLLTGESGGGLLFFENRSVLSSVQNGSPVLPAGFMLAQNYPNPFNPETVIAYQIPQSSRVRLEIFNALGQLEKVLVNAVLREGQYVARWNGTDKDDNKVASGIYFYRLTAGSFTAIKKLVLLR